MSALFTVAQLVKCIGRVDGLLDATARTVELLVNGRAFVHSALSFGSDFVERIEVHCFASVTSGAGLPANALRAMSRKSPITGQCEIR